MGAGRRRCERGTWGEQRCSLSHEAWVKVRAVGLGQSDGQQELGAAEAGVELRLPMELVRTFPAVQTRWWWWSQVDR